MEDKYAIKKDNIVESGNSGYLQMGTDALGGLTGFGSVIQKQKEEEEKNRPLTRWERKKKRMFGEAASMRRQFFNGFLVGGLVGSAFGALGGAVFAFQYK